MTTFKVHNHGHIRVVDKMGDDAAVCQMARVSYGKGTKTVNEDRGLIRYLVAHRHTSPLEGCVIKLHLKMPIFVARQWIRHRTASLNEYSARYSEMKDEFFIPEHDEVKPQSSSNKQGREGELPQLTKAMFVNDVECCSDQAYKLYKSSLEDGVSREMARIMLPLNTYTEMYWQMNLHNLLHFCALRSDPHAQKEIRDYSDIILHSIIKDWVPMVYEAFMDYQFEGVNLSGMEVDVLKDLKLKVSDEELKKAGLTAREVKAFRSKLNVTE